MDNIFSAGFLLATLVTVLLGIYFIWSRKPQKIIAGKHVVITGASKGIGLSLAIECTLKGANITLIARNEEMLIAATSLLECLRQSQQQKFQYRCLDVSDNYDEISKHLAEVEKSFGDIYMLINCAGFAMCGLFEEVPVDIVHKLMNVNYFGSYNCARYVLPKMKRAGDGIIVFCASQAALFGIYGFGPYSASKFAVRAMAETIAMESLHKGVSVTLALPCDTDTPGFEEESRTKPKETKLISGTAGIIDPAVMAKRIITDTLNGEFASYYGKESYLVTLVGGAFFPWTGIFRNCFHAILIAPLRLVSYALHFHFQNIIQKCAAENEKGPEDKLKAPIDLQRQ